MDHQKSVFLDGEGDRWFERNKSAIERLKPDDLVKSALLSLGVRPAAILEIGSATGVRVQALAETFGARGAGLDPSAKAIAEGKLAFPALDLQVGTADRLPFESHAFDVVIFGFCLYLVDPELHFAAVAEAHRVLRDHGTLVILDFIEPRPYATAYKHKAGCTSHKMEFSRYFTASPGYTHVMRQIEGSTARGERIGVDVLIKSMAGGWGEI